MELVDFLRARFDEDEEAANALDDTTWTAAIDVGDRVNTSVVTDSPAGTLTPSISGSPMLSGGDGVVAWCGPDYDGGEERAKHIARHSPARVLADVAAKRAQLDAMIGPALSSPVARTFDAGLATARFLAVPYAGHPDYREEWKP